MGVTQSLWQILVSTVRLPLRGVDWVKVKLGYISVPSLREFVYLDQTSVVSLIASTTGGITEQKSTVKRRQISGSITGGLKAGGASVGSKIGATEEEKSQAVERYVIQSNFKELYDARASDLVIADEYEPDRSIPGRIWAALFGSNEQNPIIEEDSFERGDIAEINMKLGSDSIYEVYTVLESFSDIIESFTQGTASELDLEDEDFSKEELKNISQLFEQLLEGLVPIVGEVVNYGVCFENGKARLITKEYAEEENIPYDKLKMVGFVDSSKFWQNETRFLFDGDEYTVYCRLDSGDVTNEWIPIKLLSVIDSIIPGFSDSLNDLPDDIGNEDVNSDEDNGDEISLRPRLEYFTTQIEETGDLGIDEDERDSAVNVVLQEFGETISRNEEIVDALVLLEEVLEECNFEHNLNSSELTDLREEVLRRNFDTIAEKDQKQDWYLPVSFTAIYW